MKQQEQPSGPAAQPAQLAPVTPVARKRGRRRQQSIPEQTNGLDRVFVWDIDGSLVRGDTLPDSSHPDASEPSVLASVTSELGLLARRLNTLTLAFCDQHLYLGELESSDQMHIDDVPTDDSSIAGLKPANNNLHLHHASQQTHDQNNNNQNPVHAPEVGQNHLSQVHGQSVSEQPHAQHQPPDQHQLLTGYQQSTGQLHETHMDAYEPPLYSALVLDPAAELANPNETSFHQLTNSEPYLSDSLWSEHNQHHHSSHGHLHMAADNYGPASHYATLQHQMGVEQQSLLFPGTQMDPVGHQQQQQQQLQQMHTTHHLSLNQQSHLQHHHIHDHQHHHHQQHQHSQPAGQQHPNSIIQQQRPQADHQHQHQLLNSYHQHQTQQLQEPLDQYNSPVYPNLTLDTGAELAATNTTSFHQLTNRAPAEPYLGTEPLWSELGSNQGHHQHPSHQHHSSHGHLHMAADGYNASGHYLQNQVEQPVLFQSNQVDSVGGHQQLHPTNQHQNRQHGHLLHHSEPHNDHHLHNHHHHIHQQHNQPSSNGHHHHHQQDMQGGLVLHQQQNMEVQQLDQLAPGQQHLVQHYLPSHEQQPHQGRQLHQMHQQNQLHQQPIQQAQAYQQQSRPSSNSSGSITATTTTKCTSHATTTTTTLKTVLNNHHKQLNNRLSVRFHRIKTVYRLNRTPPSGDLIKEEPDTKQPVARPSDELQEILAEIDHYTIDWRKRAMDCLRLISDSQNCTNIIVTRLPLVIALGHLVCLGLAQFFDVDQVYSASKGGKEACMKRIRKRFGATNRCTYIIVGDREDVDMAKRLDLPSWLTSRSDGHRQLQQLYRALKEGYLM